MDKQAAKPQTCTERARCAPNPRPFGASTPNEEGLRAKKSCQRSPAPLRLDCLVCNFCVHRTPFPGPHPQKDTTRRKERPAPESLLQTGSPTTMMLCSLFRMSIDSACYASRIILLPSLEAMAASVAFMATNLFHPDVLKINATPAFSQTQPVFLFCSSSHYYKHHPP